MRKRLHRLNFLSTRKSIHSLYGRYRGFLLIAQKIRANSLHTLCCAFQGVDIDLKNSYAEHARITRTRILFYLNIYHKTCSVLFSMVWLLFF